MPSLSRGAREFPARFPVVTLIIAILVSVGAWNHASEVRADVDFTSTIPPSAQLDAYREMLASIDGVRFSVIYMEADPRSGVGDLRTDAGFDALVAEQANLTEFINDTLPRGSISHALSVYEAMRAGNYMFAKLATAGNPPASAYALPSDPVTYQAVRDQVREGGSVDDVLAQDGSSALLLVFYEPRDPVQARALASKLGDVVDAWAARTNEHPATTGHATSGLLNAASYVDQVNQRETRYWTMAAGIAVLAALMLTLRGPTNALIAVASLATALLWTYGAMGLLNVRISFLTLFLAPIVIGVGIDYAVHVLQRHEEERGRAPRREAVALALRTTGGPVFVAALTTIVGLAALLRHPAPLFAQIGGVAALGVGLGVVTSLTVAPALRALIPQPRSRTRPRGDITGRVLAWMARRVVKHPVVVCLALVVLLGAASAYAWANTRLAAGSVDDELPEDDPVAKLQRRIEVDYGAFERGYLVIRGDITDPTILRAIHQAARESESIPGVRSAASVTHLLLADAHTDAGAVDVVSGTILGTAGRTPTEEADLPQTRAEARERLDRLFADPLWRSIAPFTISEDYRLAIIALTIQPWNNSQELTAIAQRLDAAAQVLRSEMPAGANVQAAGPPVNRANILEQLPSNLVTVTLGSGSAVLIVLLVAWARRGRLGAQAALAASAIVLGACVMLLASVPLLDAAYGALHQRGLAPANHAAVSDMLLLAFAVTVASGVDDMVVLASRYWEAIGSGSTPDQARDTAFRYAGRAITATTLVNVIAFAILGGTYFLQSKNLAILTAAGIFYAYLLTILIAPLALSGRAPE